MKQQLRWRNLRKKALFRHIEHHPSWWEGMVTGMNQGSGCDSGRLLVHISADQGVWPSYMHQDLPFTNSFPPDRPCLLNVLLSPQTVPSVGDQMFKHIILWGIFIPKPYQSCSFPQPLLLYCLGGWFLLMYLEVIDSFLCCILLLIRQQNKLFNSSILPFASSASLLTLQINYLLDLEF